MAVAVAARARRVLGLLGLCCALLASLGLNVAAPAMASQAFDRPSPSLAVGWSYRPPRGGPPRLNELSDRLDELTADSGAHWGIGVRDLATGETVALNLSDRFPSASLYKLGVLLEAEARLRAGRLSLDTPVYVSELDVDPMYGGSALLPGSVLSLDQALDWMTIHSDNGAAIALVRLLGGGTVVNARFHALRMWQSVFDDEALTSIADQLTLFTALGQGQAVSPEVSAAALRRLARQQINDRIPRGLPAEADWIVAHKTGDTDEVVADSGLVATPTSAYVLSLMADHITGAEPRARFATLSAAVFEAFQSEVDDGGGALYQLLSPGGPSPASGASA